MSYDMKHLSMVVVPASNASLTAGSLTSAADYASWKVMHPIQLKRIMFQVSTLTATNLILPVITVYRRPISASSSGQVALGTLTIPTGSAVDTVIYKELESVRLKAGEGLAFVVSTAGTDSVSAAGAGFVGAVILEDPESPANMSKMVASA